MATLVVQIPISIAYIFIFHYFLVSRESGKVADFFWSRVGGE